MKVLLCLLSDQHVPNLLSVHHFKPDQLLLVETSAMKSRGVAQHLLNALKLGGLDYEGRCHREPLDAEDDLASVRRTLQAAFDRFPSSEWVANVTCGTKPMSIATYEFIKALGGRIIYTSVDRPDRFMDLVEGTNEVCSHRLAIKEFLAGYGFEARKADDKMREAENRAEAWRESSILLARHASSSEILPFDDEERKKARDKGIELSRDRFAFPCQRLQQLWLGNAPTRKLTKYEVEFLTGGWLEVFFWQLLKRFAEELGIWDVRLGFEIGRCGDQSGNDFDVAFMQNFGLSMIECKSGSQENDPASDILYKIEAVTRQFRALRVRSYLATTSANVLDKDQQLKASLRSRSEIYNCTILPAPQIRKLAEETVTVEQVKQMLFAKGHR